MYTHAYKYYTYVCTPMLIVYVPPTLSVVAGARYVNSTV